MIQKIHTIVCTKEYKFSKITDIEYKNVFKFKKRRKKLESLHSKATCLKDK